MTWPLSTLHTSLPWEGRTVKRATAGVREGCQGAEAAIVRGGTALPLSLIKTISPRFQGPWRTHTTFIPPPPAHSSNKRRIPPPKDKHICVPRSINRRYSVGPGFGRTPWPNPSCVGPQLRFRPQPRQHLTPQLNTTTQPKPRPRKPTPRTTATQQLTSVPHPQGDAAIV